jgi:hypothetical protein
VIKKYRKKPVVIEAMRLSNFNRVEVADFCGEAYLGEQLDTLTKRMVGVRIGTLEGPHIASLGDYIIKGVKGEFYPCKPDIFEMTYEEEA